MNRYEIIGHEVREIIEITTLNQKVVNKPGICKVHRFELSNSGNIVQIKHFKKSTDGQNIIEEEAPSVPVNIRISGEAEIVEQVIHESQFELQGPVGLKVKVEIAEELHEGNTIEVILQ